MKNTGCMKLGMFSRNIPLLGMVLGRPLSNPVALWGVGFGELRTTTGWAANAAVRPAPFPVGAWVRSDDRKVRGRPPAGCDPQAAGADDGRLLGAPPLPPP